MKQRIKMSLKKVVALVLALTLTVAGIYIGGTTTKAESPQPTEISITGIGQHGYQDNHWRFWFTTSEALLSNRRK